MLISEEMNDFFGGHPWVRCDNAEEEDRREGNAPAGSIPPRYRDELGGINVEQVRRDQRRARQAFVRSLLRVLGERWRRP